MAGVPVPPYVVGGLHVGGELEEQRGVVVVRLPDVSRLVGARGAVRDVDLRGAEPLAAALGGLVLFEELGVGGEAAKVLVVLLEILAAGALVDLPLDVQEVGAFALALGGLGQELLLGWLDPQFQHLDVFLGAILSPVFGTLGVAGDGDPRAFELLLNVRKLLGLREPEEALQVGGPCGRGDFLADDEPAEVPLVKQLAELLFVLRGPVVVGETKSLVLGRHSLAGLERPRLPRDFGKQVFGKQVT